MKNKMIIGVDFDNTIVCYDNIFYTIAIEKRIIPSSIEPIKEEVRNYLRKIGKEELWTELQGYVYGPGIVRAHVFEGVKDFFINCKKNNIKVLIISHKTKEPFLGPKYDLHKHALDWLDKNGFFDEIGISKNEVFFELTKEGKAERIEKEGCTYFIDDLPEFFSEKFFPEKVFKILFDPNKKYPSNENLTTLYSWNNILNIIPEADFQKYFNEKILGIERVNHIGNNLLYKIILSSRNRLLKKYSKIHAQNWPRGEREYNSLKYLWGKGFSYIPEPFAFYPEDNIGIYSFEEGRVLNQEEIGENEIIIISDFITKLHSLDASKFSPASTPVLCPDDFANNVEVRIKNIKEQSNPESLDVDTKKFVFEKVIPLAENLIIDFRSKFPQEELSKEISLSEQRFNFGDFGIHNVLVDINGNFRFLDFEYFGRDDPAREILGFLHHDKHAKISKELKKLFIDNYLRKTKVSEKFFERMKAADPLKGINFVLVYLNVLRKPYIEQLKEQGADVDSVIKERIEKARKKINDINFFDDNIIE